MGKKPKKKAPDPAAAALGRKRWRGTTAAERSIVGRNAVRKRWDRVQREIERAEGGGR